MSEARGIDVAVDRGIAILRITTTPGPEAPRFSDDARASLQALRAKGLRGLLVDLSGAGAADGSGHARLASAIAPILTEWETRGLPVAVVAPDKRGALEATRVVAGAAPRWARVVGSLADAERYLSGR